MGGRPGQLPVTPPPPPPAAPPAAVAPTPPPPKPFNPNDALIADAGAQPIAAEPIAAEPLDLNSQVQQFLAQQLSGGMTGQDTMTQSALAEYDVGAERARKQQIEDLQRFGVLGGSGVSSGAVADIMGEFDVGTQRGRAGIRSQGMNRLLQSILPQATGMAQQQAALAQQQTQFGQRQALAEAGATGTFEGDETLAAKQLEQQRQLTEAGLTGKLGEEETLAAQQLAQERELAEANITGVYGEDDKETLAARQLAQQRDLAAGQLTGKFEDSETLAARQLAQQEKQFQLAQDLAREQATGKIRTGTGGMGEPIIQDTVQAQQLEQRGELERERLAQQAGQFRQQQLGEIDIGGPGFPVVRKTLQAQQLEEAQLDAADRRRLAEAAITGKLDDEETLAAQQLGQQESQFQLAQDLAREQATGDISTGRVGYMGEPVTTKSLQAQQLDEQEARRLQQESQFQSTQYLARHPAIGEITGPMGHPRQTIQAQQLAQQATQDAARLAQQQSQFEAGQDLTREQAIGDIAITGPTGHPTTTRSLQAQQLADQQELARAGLTGKLGEEDTLAAQQLAQQQTQFDESQALRRGEALGEIETVGPTGFPTPRKTLQAQQLAQQQLEHTDRQALAEAGVTGQFEEQDTLAAQQLAQQQGQFDVSSELDRARITGKIMPEFGDRPQDTLQAQQLASDQALRRAALTGTLGGEETLDTQRLAQQQKQFQDQLAISQAADKRAEEQFRERDPLSIALSAEGMDITDPALQRRIDELASVQRTPDDRAGGNQSQQQGIDRLEAARRRRGGTQSQVVENPFQNSDGQATELQTADTSAWGGTEWRNLEKNYEAIHNRSDWPDFDMSTDQLQSLTETHGEATKITKQPSYASWRRDQKMLRNRNRSQDDYEKAFEGKKGYTMSFADGTQITVPSNRESGKDPRSEDDIDRNAIYSSREY